MQMLLLFWRIEMCVENIRFLTEDDKKEGKGWKVFRRTRYPNINRDVFIPIYRSKPHLTLEGEWVDCEKKM